MWRGRAQRSRSASAVAIDVVPATFSCSGVTATARRLPVRLRLCLDTVNRLHQLGASVRGGICQDDEADAVTLTPQDLGAVRGIGRDRREQDAIERLLRNPIFFGALLSVTTHRHVSKVRNIPVKVVHTSLPGASPPVPTESPANDRSSSPRRKLVVTRRHA